MIPLLFGLSTFLRVVMYLAILIYAISQWGRSPRASRLVVIGALLMLVADVSVQVLQVVASYLLMPSSIPYAFGAIGLGSTLVAMVGLMLFVKAAFAGERRLEEVLSADFVQNASTPPSASENPYESPQ